MIQAAQLARAGYTYLGRLYSEMDCQAFVERCLRDCGLNINLPGSNAWYRKMTWVGSPEECKAKFGAIPPGAFLYILEQDGKEPEKYRKDGIGNASHIGIYTGTGTGAIHSSASKGCVVESRFTGKSIRGGWNRIGLWDQIAYDNSINYALGKEDRSLYEAKVIGGTLNLRSEDSTAASRIGRIPADSIVRAVEDLGEWIKVEYKGLTGYVMAKYLEMEGKPSGTMISVERTRLETIYDELGDLLGLRG